MTASDPQLAEIVTRFETFEVQAGRGGYTLRHRASHAPVARLRPIPDSDRFELFYWSAVRGRWRTFGDFGRLKLTLERAHEIVHTEPSSTCKPAELRSTCGQGQADITPQNGQSRAQSLSREMLSRMNRL
jgi:hypothetical protein